MFVHVGLDIRNDDLGALHDAPADDDHFGVISVNQGDCVDGPDIEASVANGKSDFVSARSLLEQLLEANVRKS